MKFIRSHKVKVEMCQNSNNQFQLEPELPELIHEIQSEPELFRNVVLTLIIHETA